MATAEAILEQTEKQSKLVDVCGQIGVDDHATLVALVRTCGYQSVDAFVSEAVAEKVKNLQTKVQQQFGPKKKK